MLDEHQTQIVIYIGVIVAAFVLLIRWARKVDAADDYRHENGPFDE
jgi:hypothetical protein